MHKFPFIMGTNFVIFKIKDVGLIFESTNTKMENR